ncbi:hypothetical protein P692DRAFT_20297266 [Suillus brevipes Sb2]|nr:hypothetical protein P692DRAFT_20297266 [Suillus brevipes Sb2]
MSLEVNNSRISTSKIAIIYTIVLSFGFEILLRMSNTSVRQLGSLSLRGRTSVSICWNAIEWLLKITWHTSLNHPRQVSGLRAGYRARGTLSTPVGEPSYPNMKAKHFRPPS